MTLMEILVVISIIAIVLGMSTAFLQTINRAYRFTSAANQVATIVRAARNFALSSQSQAAVEVDAKNGVVYALGQKSVADWHLEGPLPETSGGHALTGAGEPAPGKIGGSLRLGGQGAYLSAGPAYKLAAAQGVAVSAWFYPEFGPGKSVLFQYGKALTVEWSDDGAVTARAGLKEAVTPPAVLVPFKWTLVEVVADGAHVSVAVDGVILAEEEERAPLAPGEGHFTVGAAKSSYLGRVDEVRMAQVIRPEELVLPEGVRIVQAPRRVRFDRQGNLEAAVHVEPVEIWLYADKEKAWRKIEISLMGRVRLTEHDKGPLPPPVKKPAGGGSGAPGKAEEKKKAEVRSVMGRSRSA